MSTRFAMPWAAFALASVAAVALLSPARAALGRLDQRNYARCMEYAADDAKTTPAGSERDAAYEAMRKACYQKFFLDRLDADR